MTVIAIVVVAVLTVGLIRVIGTFLVLSGGGGTEYHVNCEKTDGPLRDEWIISDNITSYEDIPQSQKTTLSNDSVERLKDLSPRFYNATDYAELSNEKKEIFRRAIDDATEVDNVSKTPDRLVVYQENVYSCTVDRYVPGA
ncbi:MAG: hypothetical protein U5J64_07830 [Halobacteriales archaeon]|nr:hypothetical protein [Halobacteriales archaeon]